MSESFLSVRSNIKDLERDLGRFMRDQIPFASAQALNEVALAVQDAEKRNMVAKLDRPTPFTVNSVRVRRANKAMPEALVVLQDIAAAYLEPFEFKGKHKLPGSGRTWLNPKDIQLNSYGNIPKSKLAALRARSDVFVGVVKTRDGKMVSGVWQRPASNAAQGKGKPRGRGANKTGHLKLLIRFGDAIEVRTHLGWVDVAQRIVAARFDKALSRALGRAVASAR